MGVSRFARALQWMHGVHAAAAALVLLWMGAALVGAAGDGFLPSRERHGAVRFQARGSVAFLARSMFGGHTRGVELVLLGGSLDDPDWPALGMARRLQEVGFTVHADSGGDPVEAARGAHAVLLTAARPEYRDPDYAALREAMDGNLIVDYVGLWDSGPADAAGLVYFLFAGVPWPPWMDPELHVFVEDLREAVARDEGILMVPGSTLDVSTGARARWYLSINEMILPRRLYLWNPEGATSFVTEYFDWVDAYNDKAPWENQARVPLTERRLSRHLPSVPTRTLSPGEVAAARRLDVQWVLFWRHNMDFQLRDYELVPLETVLRWSRDR